MPRRRAGSVRAGKLAFAALNEQRAARRWRIFTRLCWLAFWPPGLDADVTRTPASSAKSTPHTAVVDVKGEIASGADTSAEYVVAACAAVLRG